MSILCKILPHRRTRNVWYDGVEFRSTCRGCGRPMIRDGISGTWRLFDRSRDFRVDRQGHPG